MITVGTGALYEVLPVSFHLEGVGTLWERSFFTGRSSLPGRANIALVNSEQKNKAVYLSLRLGLVKETILVLNFQLHSCSRLPGAGLAGQNCHSLAQNKYFFILPSIFSQG